MNIKGKPYKTVAEKITEFRDEHPFWSLETELEIEVDFCTARAWVKDETGRILATGTARELREGKNPVNKDWYIENAETSAVGRALSFMGYASEVVASLDNIFEAVKRAGSVEALVNLWNTHVELQSNPDFVQRFASRKAELTKKSTK